MMTFTAINAILRFILFNNSNFIQKAVSALKYGKEIGHHTHTHEH